MNQKALHTLEYDKIIRLLIDKATSDPGRRMCENLQPGNSISQIDLRQEQTAAALDRLFKKAVFLLETIMIFLCLQAPCHRRFFKLHRASADRRAA